MERRRRIWVPIALLAIVLGAAVAALAILGPSRLPALRVVRYAEIKECEEIADELWPLFDDPKESRRTVERIARRVGVKRLVHLEVAMESSSAMSGTLTQPNLILVRAERWDKEAQYLSWGDAQLIVGSVSPDQPLWRSMCASRSFTDEDTTHLAGALAPIERGVKSETHWIELEVVADHTPCCFLIQRRHVDATTDRVVTVGLIRDTER